MSPRIRRCRSRSRDVLSRVACLLLQRFLNDPLQVLEWRKKGRRLGRELSVDEQAGTAGQVVAAGLFEGSADPIAHLVVVDARVESRAIEADFGGDVAESGRIERTCPSEQRVVKLPELSLG